MRAADPELVVDELGHRRGGLRRQRPDRAGVQVDPGAERGQRPADGRELLVIGQEGGDHAPYDIGDVLPPPVAGSRGPARRAASPGRSSSPRPTGWPTSSAGPRSGSSTSAGGPTAAAATVWAAGHIPGAVHRRLASRPDRPVARRGDTLLLAGPEQVARTLAPRRRRRRRDGRRLRRHASACSPPGRGGACGSTASSRSGSSTAATRAWAEEGRPISNAVAPPPPAHFTPRAQPRMRLTTSDVRALLVVAGRDAARRARAGRVPRPRGQHEAARPHPGRGQRAGRGDDAARQPALQGRRRAARACCSRRTSRAAGGWSATTASGIAAAKLAFALTLLGPRRRRGV